MRQRWQTEAAYNVENTRPQIEETFVDCFGCTYGTEAVTIPAKDNDAHFQIISNIQALTRGLYRVRFDAEYDVAGEQKSKKTDWLYVYRK